MTTEAYHEITTETQENTMSPALVPALTAPSTGAIEQDEVPAGADHAGRIREKNCARKSRRMQETLEMMAGWTP